MPIYEFKCGSCYNNFEDLCSLGTNSVNCPKCGSSDTKRKISSFGIGVGKSNNSKSSETNCSSCHGGHCHSCH